MRVTCFWKIVDNMYCFAFDDGFIMQAMQLHEGTFCSYGEQNEKRLYYKGELNQRLTAIERKWLDSNIEKQIA